MKEQLEKLKAELREFIELSKTIPAQKWAVDSANSVHEIGTRWVSVCYPFVNKQEQKKYATFIARSRNISPAMAECLLVAVEGLEWMICGCHGSEVCDNDGRGCRACEHAEAKLDQIINLWNLK
jgi:hypothetical protein